MTLTANFAPSLATLARLSNDPLQPWFEKTAERIGKQVEGRIRATKLDPDFKAWAPWAPSTEYSRLRKGNAMRGLLYDEGTLLAGITHRATLTGVEVGVEDSVDYAGFLQYGTRNMPARPFLGWRAPMLAWLELDAAIYLSLIR